MSDNAGGEVTITIPALIFSNKHISAHQGGNWEKVIGIECFSENIVLFAVAWFSGAASATHMKSKNTPAPLTATMLWPQ